MYEPFTKSTLKRKIGAKPLEILFGNLSAVMHHTASLMQTTPCKWLRTGRLAWSWEMRVISTALTAGKPAMSDGKTPTNKQA